MDVPQNEATYLHRVGRAGRFGTHGLVITIIESTGQELQRLLVISRKIQVDFGTFQVVDGKVNQQMFDGVLPSLEQLADVCPEKLIAMEGAHRASLVVPVQPHSSDTQVQDHRGRECLRNGTPNNEGILGQSLDSQDAVLVQQRVGDCLQNGALEDGARGIVEQSLDSQDAVLVQPGVGDCLQNEALVEGGEELKRAVNSDTLVEEKNINSWIADDEFFKGLEKFSSTPILSEKKIIFGETEGGLSGVNSTVAGLVVDNPSLDECQVPKKVVKGDYQPKCETNSESVNKCDLVQQSGSAGNSCCLSSTAGGENKILAENCQHTATQNAARHNNVAASPVPRDSQQDSEVMSCGSQKGATCDSATHQHGLQNVAVNSVSVTADSQPYAGDCEVKSSESKKRATCDTHQDGLHNMATNSIGATGEESQQACEVASCVDRNDDDEWSTVSDHTICDNGDGPSVQHELFSIDSDEGEVMPFDESLVARERILSSDDDDNVSHSSGQLPYRESQSSNHKLERNVSVSVRSVLDTIDSIKEWLEGILAGECDVSLPQTPQGFPACDITRRSASSETEQRVDEGGDISQPSLQGHRRWRPTQSHRGAITHVFCKSCGNIVCADDICSKCRDTSSMQKSRASQPVNEWCELNDDTGSNDGQPKDHVSAGELGDAAAPSGLQEYTERHNKKIELCVRFLCKDMSRLIHTYKACCSQFRTHKPTGLSYQELQSIMHNFVPNATSPPSAKELRPPLVDYVSQIYSNVNLIANRLTADAKLKLANAGGVKKFLTALAEGSDDDPLDIENIVTYVTRGTFREPAPNISREQWVYGFIRHPSEANKYKTPATTSEGSTEKVNISQEISCAIEAPQGSKLNPGVPESRPQLIAQPLELSQGPQLNPYLPSYLTELRPQLITITQPLEVQPPKFNPCLPELSASTSLAIPHVTERVQTLSPCVPSLLLESRAPSESISGQDYNHKFLPYPSMPSTAFSHEEWDAWKQRVRQTTQHNFYTTYMSAINHC